MASRVCLLASAGIESAAMLTLATQQEKEIYVFYAAFGLIWEKAEWEHLQKLLSYFPVRDVRKVQVQGMYPEKHWSLSGKQVPDALTPDVAVLLPARNVILVSLGLPYCMEKEIEEIWLGSLKSNPFPDATPSFRKQMEALVQEGTSFPLRLCFPLSFLEKREVLREFPQAPFHDTFSCIQPAGKEHCGVCNKCGERKKAFREAALSDPTFYARSLYS